jgi:arginase
MKPSAHSRPVEIIGVPLDLGQTERGTDVGPSALRYAGLAEQLSAQGHPVNDRGNLPVPSGAVVSAGERTRIIAEVNQRLFEQVRSALGHGALALVLGGDHSVAIGSVAASAAHGRAGLLWVDAHGDFNTPATSPSGNVHGMPLAVILGQGASELVAVGMPEVRRLRAEDVVVLGVRQLDSGEREALRAAGVRVFSMRDVDERGMSAVANEALALLAHCDFLHLSLDIDAMEPLDAPGVGTPVRGGLSYREMQLLMEMVADTERLAVMDVVEINPMLDVRNQTAKTAVETLLESTQLRQRCISMSMRGVRDALRMQVESQLFSSNR